MAAALLSFGSAVLLAHGVGLAPVALAVPSVIFALSLGRRPGGEPLGECLANAAVFAVLAGVATWTGLQLTDRPVLGAAVFVALMSLSIWSRRFGARATRTGAMVLLALVAALIVPTAAARGTAWPLCGWAALVGLIAFGWVQAVRRTADRLTRTPRPAPQAAARAGKPKHGLRVSTRMALQMAVSLAAAFVAGHLFFGVHWQWTVLSAMVVNTGTVGRGDVVLKGVERTAGAIGGTLLAAALALAIRPGGALCITLIFVVLAVATLLRRTSYAFWAAGLTTAMSLLYGYFGESAGPLLETRLQALAMGAALTVATAWLLTPVRTGEVLRGRFARAQAALTALLTARRAGQDTTTALARFEHAVAELEAIARPLELHRRIAARPGPSSAPHRADVIDALRACRLAVRGPAPDAASAADSTSASASASAVEEALNRLSRTLPALKS
ncbi:FUSC family protein [Streptacidiphilus sp. PAMC 29251]